MDEGFDTSVDTSDFSDDVSSDFSDDVSSDFSDDTSSDFSDDVSSDIPDEIPEDTDYEESSDMDDDIMDEIPEDTDYEESSDMDDDIVDEVPEDKDYEESSDMDDDIMDEIPEDTEYEESSDMDDDIMDEIPEDTDYEESSDMDDDIMDEIPEDTDYEESSDMDDDIMDEIPEDTDYEESSDMDDDVMDEIPEDTDYEESSDMDDDIMDEIPEDTEYEESSDMDDVVDEIPEDTEYEESSDMDDGVMDEMPEDTDYEESSDMDDVVDEIPEDTEFEESSDMNDEIDEMSEETDMEEPLEEETDMEDAIDTEGDMTEELAEVEADMEDATDAEGDMTEEAPEEVDEMTEEIPEETDEMPEEMDELSEEVPEETDMEEPSEVEADMQDAIDAEGDMTEEVPEEVDDMSEEIPEETDMEEPAEVMDEMPEETTEETDMKESSEVEAGMEDVTDTEGDMMGDALEEDQKVLKRDEYDLLRSGNDAINQRLEAQEDDYRDKGLSEEEIQDRLAADRWNFQKEFLDEAFPGQDVSPNVFNGFSENGAQDRINDIDNSETLRNQLDGSEEPAEAGDFAGEEQADDVRYGDLPKEGITEESTKIPPEITDGVPETENFPPDNTDEQSAFEDSDDSGDQKVLKRDEYDLLKSGNDAINQRLEAQEDDYRDKGLSEEEIQDRLAADRWNFQKEFLDEAFPGQDVSPNVFNGFSENGAQDRIDDINNSEALREQLENNKVPETSELDKYESPVLNNADNLGQWDEIPSDLSYKDNLEAANPNYENGEEWQINCQRCVPTYEMRSRGYDVTAQPCVEDYDYLSYHPYDVWEGADVKNTSGNGLTEIQNSMKDWGDGARAQVCLQWGTGDGGHTFTAEQRDGQTYFVDPQTGDTDVAWYFDEAKPDTVSYCRTDNLMPSSYILDCCKGAKR